jgi:hypothetical protein
MLPARADFQELKARVTALTAGSGSIREPHFDTTIPALDALRIPAGALVALEGSGTAGCRSIAAALLARATCSGLGAIVDAGELYPPDLEAAGVRLDRLLIVPARSALIAARAVDLLLRTRTARVVVMAAGGLRAAVWARLARLAHKAGAVLVVIGNSLGAELSAIATLVLAPRLVRPLLRGRGIWGIFAGFELAFDVQKRRRYR